MFDVALFKSSFNGYRFRKSFMWSWLLDVYKITVKTVCLNNISYFVYAFIGKEKLKFHTKLKKNALENKTLLVSKDS